MRRIWLSAASAALAAIWAAAPSVANDSLAEVAIGGLTLTTTDAISMDSEDLYISRDEVKVDYRFTNTTGKDIEALVAFPLPDQTSDPDTAVYNYESELKFKTVVDGKTVPFEIVEQAMVDGQDVTQRLKELGLTPSGPADWQAFEAQVKALSPEQIKAAVSEGLLANMGAEEDPSYFAQWSTRTTVTRKQLFPAGKTISVQHSYRPLVGGSVGGNLNKEYRTEPWQKEHAADYCIEDSWFTAFDKQLASRATEMNGSPYSEWWIGYVLSSGANWKGPIKDFRLVVDKGKPENLLSFCAEGVKKIAPTQFEVRKSNFEPDKDLKILIVEWIDGQQ